MGNEIEKMYENAGIKSKAECTSKVCIVTNPHKDWCNKCESLKYEYPPFTATKKLELVKWLSNNDKDKNKELTLYNSAHPYYYFALHHEPAQREDDMWSYGEGLGTTFEDGLAKLINDLWQDLTEEEKSQIKNILESEVRE